MTFADSVLSALQAAPGATALQVGDASAAGLTAPYCVVWTASRLDGEGLDQRSDRATVDISVSSVGATRAAADAVASRVRGVLVDASLTVDGWECGPIRHLTSPPTSQDPQTAAPNALWLAVDQFRFTATRA